MQSRRISRISLLAIHIAVLLLVVRCSSPSAGDVIEAEKLQSDFKQLRQALEKNHPALYVFTAKSELDQLFEEGLGKIDRPMSLDEFYRIAAPVVAAIGCGHARLRTPEGYWDAFPSGLFPVDVAVRGDRLFAVGEFSGGESMPRGAEIVRIDDRPAPPIVKSLKSMIAADGHNYSSLSWKLEQLFVYLYAIVCGRADSFEVTYRQGNSDAFQVSSLSSVDISIVQGYTRVGEGKKTSTGDPDLDFAIAAGGKAAIITFGSFGYYDERERFYSFVDSAFAVVSSERIPNVILDFRGNDGGDPFCTTHLLSYIAPRPLTYFAREYHQYEAFARPIPLAKDRFGGNLYILIDGGCFSSTGHLCAVLDYHGIGTFIGTETGGTYTCNDASTEVVLDHSRFRLIVARMTFVADVHGMPRDRGIIPDHIVEQNIGDMLEGRDTALEFILELVTRTDR